MKISEITVILAAVLATLGKVSLEFMTRIAALEGLITAQSANGEVPAEVVAQLEALKAAAQQLDDLNPDITAAIETVQASDNPNSGDATGTTGNAGDGSGASGDAATGDQSTETGAANSAQAEQSV